MMPRRLLGRLVLLLAGVLVLNTIIGVTLLLVAARETTLTHTVRSLQVQIIAADSLFADLPRADAETRLRELGLEHREAPPQPSALMLPFLEDVSRDIAHNLPDRRLQPSDQPMPMLWISAQPPIDGWIGIPLLSLRGALRWSSVAALICAVLLTFGCRSLVCT